MSRFYCHDVDCRGSSGFAGVRVPDSGPTFNSGGEPGWWEPEECPHCGAELFDERLEWENPMETLGEALEENGELIDDERGDTDWQSVYGAIQKELNRQRELRRRLDREAREREAEYERAVAAGEREPEPALPF